MKSLLLLIFAICTISFFSCGQGEDKTKTPDGNSSEESKSPQSNTTANQTNIEKEDQRSEKGKSDEHESESKKRSDNSGGIRVNFPTGATQVTLNGKITGFNDQKTYVFEVSKGQKLTASVKPNPDDGNIRIAQIISPSGQADGPFGNKMTYSLNESGDWKLVLSEDMMSGDPWKGEYFLTVEIK